MIQKNKIKALFLLLSFFTTNLLCAKNYMVQIKPYQSYEIKSQSSGPITYIKKNSESKYIKEAQVLIEIDAKDEKREYLKQKASFDIQKEIVKIKEINYKAKQGIKNLSKYDKNQEKLSFLEAKKILLTNKYEMQMIQREIDKKVFTIKHKYIDEIFIKEGEYVSVGEKLFEMYDITKLKITLYLTKNEIKNLEKKEIFINDILSDFRLKQVSKIKDEIKVSRYKVQFIKENKNLDEYFFDEIVRVEIK